MLQYVTLDQRKRKWC